tara:strand:+ start:292 stop:528 length:237 start_codon:yes stop_codon:yes gene_type:complete
MTAEELRQVAQRAYSPIDSKLADLWDKSLRYSADRFAREVEKAIQEAPALFDLMQADELARPLEDEMGRAMIRQLKDG